jgi:hypothetical protein
MDKYNKVNSDCYLFACKDYDEELHIYKAAEEDFCIKIRRDIQPNIIRVFDFIATD